MPERRPSDHRTRVALVLLAVVLLYIAYWILMLAYFNDWKKGADFGNAFGAASALFSGLALGALVFTIFLQNSAVLAAHEGLRKAVEAQEKTEELLRKTMESEALIKLFEEYREIRKRRLEYSGPEPVWDWDAFNRKYPAKEQRERSYEWRYLTDRGGFYELCGILLRQGYISEELVKALPRAKGFWAETQQIVSGMRKEQGEGLWGSWEYFVQRQEELTKASRFGPGPG